MNAVDESVRRDVRETMRSHGICVIVPTYNNGGTLTDVLDGILDYCDDVIVVNDGSTDDTAAQLESYGGIIDVVGYSRNRGKGYALKRGFRHAMERGFDYAVTIDSDGQHYASDIPAFVKAVVQNPGALVVGERDLSGVDINGKSSFANKFSNFWFTVQTTRRLKDTQTGFRAYPLRELSGLDILTSRYEAELELLVFAAWKGVSIVSIPISVYYPPQSERVSHFRPALDFTRISILNTILCFAAILYGGPRMCVEAVRRKKIFGKEFRFFTRRGGKMRDAAFTFDRFFRSIYGFSFFAVWATVLFTPISMLMFSIGKVTEKRRMRYHRMMQGAGKFLSEHYPGGKLKFMNPGGEDFSKPALVICNHQSHLDLPVIMSTSPRLIFLTNDWVWNSKVYGLIIRNAEYLPVSEGIDTILPKLRNLRDRGYSIMIFPEGTRSEDSRILRFHQGAFFIARALDIDIVPMVLHGAGEYLPKNDAMFRKGTITLEILPRIKREDMDPEMTMLKEASMYRKIIKARYDELADETEKSEYFVPRVFNKYAYRGWNVVSEMKGLLKKLPKIGQFIDNEPKELKRVRIINSGIGVIPMLYALVNKDVEVDAFEENISDHEVAAATSGVPDNLHYRNAVMESDYNRDTDYDRTYVIVRNKRDRKRFSGTGVVYIDLDDNGD